MVAAPAWADGKRDFNGDGRGDLLALFDYGNGDTGLWVFPGAPNRPDGQPGQIGAYEAWETGPGNYWISATKNVAGDFNGDGRTDIMSLYDYGNGAAGLFVIPGTGGSGPTATDAYRVWYTPPGNFWLSDVKVAAGDVNGDGKDDLIAVYHYPDDTMGVWVFPGTASVGDGSSEPYESWQSLRGWYPPSEVWGFTAGDINGDGRDELVGLTDYTNSLSIIWVWPNHPSGGPSEPYQIYWDPNWEPNVGQPAQLTTFNQNNDGMDDIAVVSNAEIRIFNGTDKRIYGYSTPWVVPLEYPSDSAVLTRSVITSADIDGDGEGELIGMLDNGGTVMWVLASSPVRLLNWDLVPVWSAIPGDFPMSRTKVAR
ncbi:hypothetical protein Raf01_49700 [Rugosimonospora africana]|uniref:VCBS repeat-containing protein n=2 Tax=Rugosimonospora africana TaxID=556532 RepID=A0A8J3VST0_9ACTN|nr:hypothetical protein Raf01_49700 [Rugosimonospora africana]